MAKKEIVQLRTISKVLKAHIHLLGGPILSNIKVFFTTKVKQ